MDMTFEQWKAIAYRVNIIRDKLLASRRGLAFSIAISHGISPDACCIHNAALDDKMEGWCHRNPERLKAAKLANRILNDWSASEKAKRIIDRAWKRHVSSN